MLLQYSVQNYKTFKDKSTFSFIASNYDKTTLEESNITTILNGKLRVLNCAAIYGANACGKTKLFESLSFMRKLVLTSSKESQKGERIDVKPFLLSEDTENEPSEFEIIFYYKEGIYRYGFEVNSYKVLSEWLYYRPNKKEIELFFRDEDAVDIHKTRFPKGRMLVKENLIRDNALLLSVAAQFNDEFAGNVLNWFKNLRVISSIQEENYKGFTMRQVIEDRNHDSILNMLEAADLGIKDVQIKRLDKDTLPEDIPIELKKILLDKLKDENTMIFADSVTTHNKYDRLNNIIGNVQFSMTEDESHGTQKFYYLSGPILDAIEKGLTLFIDELDSRLHPNLVYKIISIFNSKTLNKNNAQLVFNTHNTRVLRADLLRRDQIWFIEKDQHEASRLYSLSDFKSDKVRKTENFEINYLRGKYGAVPYLEFFDDMLIQSTGNVNGIKE